MKRLTEFQQTLKAIDEWKPTKEEQAFIDKYFPHLSEAQIKNMYYRHQIHLTNEEKGEGLHKIKERERRELPKAFDCLYDERTELNTLWKIYCKLIWWRNYNHKTVEEKWWNYGEKLLKRGPKTRRTNHIDYPKSVMEHRIVLT